jgi:acyl carrier protein
VRVAVAFRPAASAALLLAGMISAANCARRTTPVSPALRAAVGRELAVDASRIDPDQSLVTIKPDLDDVGTVALVLGLGAAFDVDIRDATAAEALGFRPHAPPAKLTLTNLARLIAASPRARPRPAPATPAPIAAAAAARPSPPKLVNGGYELACNLPPLPSARARIDRDNHLALIAGGRVVDTVTLDGEFYGADAQVTCADGFITLLHDQPNGRSRALSFAWKEGHLVPGVKGDEVP